MKVLLAPAEFYFKPGNYHVTFNILKRVNAEFTILCGNVHPDVKKVVRARIFELGQPFYIYPLKILRFGLKLKTDIIHHISPFAIGKDFNLLALKTDKPFVIGPMEIPHKFFEDEARMFKIPFILKTLRDSKIREILSVKTMERCDIAITVNRATEKYLKEFVDKENVRIIPLGVDTKFFKYSTPPNNYEILAVGIHIKRKGFDYLIRTMKEIVKEYPEAKLHITSQGPQTENLKRLVKSLDLEKHVIFHGRVSDEKLLELYRNCRVFVHPSISESFSPVRLEAMAVGRPVVATTAASGADEMIKNGKTGFLIPPADEEAIVKAVLKIFDDYDLTIRMGRNARKIVEEKYDWDLIAKEYYNVYRELV